MSKGNFQFKSSSIEAVNSKFASRLKAKNKKPKDLTRIEQMGKIELPHERAAKKKMHVKTHVIKKILGHRLTGLQMVDSLSIILNMFGIVDSVDFILSEFIMS